jgi:hypothetical protein
MVEKGREWRLLLLMSLQHRVIRMNTLLACSRALLLLVLAPALLGEARPLGERGARPDSSRPLLDMRDVVGVVMSNDRTDVYWVHTNELVEPVHSTLYRTGISADGRSRLDVTRIHEFEESVGAHVSGAGGNVQVIWKTYPAGIVVSPIEHDALKYPQGKPVTAFGDYPRIRCHATECVAEYDVSHQQTAAILDADGNVVSGPFPLPSGFYPVEIAFDEHGIFFVRHNLTELRAALVRRDGSVQYDVRLASANPRQFQTTSPGVTTVGSEYVVAFVEFETAPDEVHAVTIGTNGSVSAPKSLMQVMEHRDFPSNLGGVSLASSGSRFLLGGRYGIGPSFLVLLDASLEPTGPAFNDEMTPSLYPHPDGSSFVIVWDHPTPYVTVVRADGSMTAPVWVVPSKGRRRAVR